MTHRKGKKPKNNQGKQWTREDIQKLKKLAKNDKNNPVGIIADLLGRTQNAVYTKASQKKISLKPINRSPYNRRKKK